MAVRSAAVARRLGGGWSLLQGLGMVPRQPCLSICKGKGSVRGGKFRQGGPVTLTGPHGGLSSSSSPSTGAHRGVLLCQPEWWVARTLLPGLCPARPTPACQHLPGHAEPGQSAQHTREGVWPPVGARALSPEGRERREGCRLCSTTSVLLGAKSSLRFIPVGLRPGQPLSAFEPGP